MGFSWFILVVSSVALVPTLEAVLDDCSYIGGFLVPVFTPANDNYTVVYDIIGQYAQFLHDKGVNGVVVAATLGEGPSLSESDNKKLLDAWMKVAKPLNMLVISSVGATPMPFTLEMTRYSEEIGVDGIFAMSDGFFKPTTAEELTDYMKRLSEVAPETPLVYDDIPYYTDVDEVDMEEFFDLAKAQVPTFRGVKSNVFQNLLLLKNKATGPLRIYASTYDRPTPYYIAAQAFLGFTDFVLGELNFFPEEIIDIINSASGFPFYGPNTFTYQYLSDLFDIIAKKATKGQLIAALKEALPLVTGVDAGPPLPPLEPLTDEEIEEIKQGLIEQNIRIVTSDTETYDYKK